MGANGLLPSHEPDNTGHPDNYVTRASQLTQLWEQNVACVPPLSNILAQFSRQTHPHQIPPEFKSGQSTKFRFLECLYNDADDDYDNKNNC